MYTVVDTFDIDNRFLQLHPDADLRVGHWLVLAQEQTQEKSSPAEGAAIEVQTPDGMLMIASCLAASKRHGVIAVCVDSAIPKGSKIQW